MNDLNTDFQLLMDQIVLEHGYPNRVANLHNLDAELIDGLIAVLETELIERSLDNQIDLTFI